MGSFIFVRWHSLSSKPGSQDRGRVSGATSFLQVFQREGLLWDWLLLQMGYTVLPEELQNSPQSDRNFKVLTFSPSQAGLAVNWCVCRLS